MGFLELQQELGVYSRVTVGKDVRNSLGSAKSGFLSSYDGQLRKLN